MNIDNASCRSSGVFVSISISDITLLVHTFREALGGALLSLAGCRSAPLDSGLRLSVQSGPAVAGGGANAEQVVGSTWQHRGVSISICSTSMYSYSTVCTCLYWSGLYSLSKRSSVEDGMFTKQTPSGERGALGTSWIGWISR